MVFTLKIVPIFTSQTGKPQIHGELGGEYRSALPCFQAARLNSKTKLKNIYASIKISSCQQDKIHKVCSQKLLGMKEPGNTTYN